MEFYKENFALGAVLGISEDLIESWSCNDYEYIDRSSFDKINARIDRELKRASEHECKNF